MRRAPADFPAGDDAELVGVYFDSLVGGAVCHIQHPVWPQMDVVRSAQPPDGSALFPCIGVDDRNGAVAFVGGVDPRGGQEIRDGAEGEEKGERSSPEGHHIKFMNLVLVSSMMASVTWAAPRSIAIRSISMERGAAQVTEDRKSTRLNSSHVRISYAVFCLEKNNK